MPAKKPMKSAKKSIKPVKKPASPLKQKVKDKYTASLKKIDNVLSTLKGMKAHDIIQKERIKAQIKILEEKKVKLIKSYKKKIAGK